MKTKYPLSRKEFLAIYKKVPRLCIELLIETVDGLVLTKRAIHPYPGTWHLPGGTLFCGESLEHAAKRIAKAETNVDITLGELFSLGQYRYQKLPNYPTHDVTLIFLAKPRQSKYTLKPDEQAEMIACFKTVPKTKIFPWHKKLLKEYHWPVKS